MIFRLSAIGVLVSVLCAQVSLPLLGVGTSPAAGGGTPTLVSFLGKVGIDFNRGSTTTGINGNIFTLDPSGYPRAVTSGSLIVISGAWPDAPTGSNGPHACSTPCESTWTNNGSANTWNRAFTIANCRDANGIDHNIYYSVNSNANTNQITETHPDKITNSYFNISNWYNIATTSATDGGSCLTGVTPANNTAPNISGTAFTTGSNGDLIYIEVDDNSNGGGVNTISSITVPAGCTLLDENTYQGHFELFCIQTTAGSFTPKFTVAQATNDTFTIYAQAFKSGSGGSAPGTTASVLVSNQDIISGAVTLTRNVACPTSTSTLVVTDDAGDGSISDSNSDTFTKEQNGGVGAILWYKTGISISNTNTFTVTITNSGNVDEYTYYCTNATAVDSLTAGSGNTQVDTNTVGNTVTATGGGVANGDPTATPGTANDLVIGIGSMGTGPVLTCSTSGCVYDYPSPTLINACSVTTAGVCGGDANDYTNGDGGWHYWQSGTAQISFNWTVNPSQSWTVIATAFH